MKKLKKIFVLFAITFYPLTGFAQDFDKIGEEHNKLVSQISSSDLLNKKSDNALKIISERMNDKYDTSEVKKLMDSYPKNIENYGNPNLFLEEMNKKVNFSKDLMAKMNELIKKVSVMDSDKQVSDFVEKERKNIKNLSNKDAESYLLALSILKHSSLFWDREAQNGKKYFDKEYKGGPYNPELLNPKLSLGWKVAICDVVGGLAGAYKGGWVGALIWGVASSVMTYVAAQ